MPAPALELKQLRRQLAHATSNPLALFARADEHRDFALSVYQAGGLPELAPVCQAPNTQTQPPLPFTEATSSMTDLTIQRLLSDAKEAIFEMNIARNLVQQQRESQS
ncbi:hypothetical protein BC830DRAFT_1130800 [Chytriomyces sp. MP71]|nr:hypothetical protein BC830DRAFT_1130800 [Chytriomyces sp. MP71]